MVGESAPPDCVGLRATGTVGLSKVAVIAGEERNSSFVSLAAAGRPWLVAQSAEGELVRGSTVLDWYHVEAFALPLSQCELVGL